LRNPGPAPGPKGGVMVVSFELSGHPFTALNGGPGFPFTQAVSFYVSCRDQAEIDHYWSRLTEGGREVACGWLVDKFGLSWQVVPENILDLVRHPAAMQAMMGMVKFDIAALQAAARE
jgi:predicted 3-demethylubiquinone-9 3-methyltransferase (glyoxalase superfamily)